MFGKHFLPICGLFLYFLNSVITIGEVLNFGKITLPDFPLMVYIFLCSKNSLSNLRSLRFFLCFLQFYICFEMILVTDKQSTWVEVNFFFFFGTRMSNCSSTICWKGYLFCNDLPWYHCAHCMSLFLDSFDVYIYTYADTPLSWLL